MAAVTAPVIGYCLLVASAIGIGNIVLAQIAGWLAPVFRLRDWEGLYACLALPSTLGWLVIAYLHLPK